jgi:hypothetical protein
MQEPEGDLASPGPLVNALWRGIFRVCFKGFRLSLGSESHVEERTE